MKIIRTKHIPLKGFAAMNFFGIILARKDKFISERTIRHEMIHTAQMKELLYLLFYFLYVMEWLIRLAIYWNAKKAYRNISFEREAYANQKDKEYLAYRKHFKFLKYIKQ